MKRTKNEARFIPLPLKCLYTMTELTRATNADRRLLARLVSEMEIKLVRADRKTFIPLSEIAEKLPEVWRSIEMSEALRHQAAGGSDAPADDDEVDTG